MFYLTIILAAAAIASSLFAFFTGQNARKAREQKIVYDLMFEYRTVHMLAALRSLHEFHEEYTKKGKHIKAIYDKFKREDEEQYKKLPANEKTIFLVNTLHNQRRLVSQFYAIMKTTLDLKLVPEEYIFRFWDSHTLKRILEIIDSIGHDKDKGLMSIYNQAVKYEKRKEVKLIDR